MPHFFFHLHEDEAVFLDEEGGAFADLEDARQNALKNAREMACAEVSDGHLIPRHSIRVIDDAGLEVGKVTFGEAAGLADDWPASN